MNQTRRAIGGLLALGLVLAAGPAFGQITGTILGTVSDDQGLVLPGTSVSVSSDQLPGGPRSAVTNASGQYRFPNLPPGDYTLTVELSGFGTYIEEGMQVLVGGTAERNVSLSLATVAETVTVTGETPVVDTRKSGVSTNYSSEYMENTPLRRVQLLRLHEVGSRHVGHQPDERHEQPRLRVRVRGGREQVPHGRGGLHGPGFPAPPGRGRLLT